ncbi:MAG: hypothetical protein DYH08_04945 [Actinobacteria bacterium ATB1]|nr:hypothetical protein [Actinobacteria bacterium ATB1]
MDRSRKLIRDGLRENSSWKLGFGVLGFVFGYMRREARREPETVQRLLLVPGDKVVIQTREPERRSRKRRRRP